MRCLLLILLCCLLSVSCDSSSDYTADLVVTDVAIDPVDPEPGQTIVVTFRIENQGKRSAGDFSWVLVRSGAGVLTVRRISGIASERQSAVQLVTITEVAGTHTYRILLDVYDEIDEGVDGKDNNEHIFIVDVRPSGDG